MDLSSLRALAFDLNVSAHGVDVTVTTPDPDAEPIETRGIWATPTTELLPGGFDVQRAEPRRVLVLPSAEVPTVPRGTIILAPEHLGGDVLRWRVDGIDRIEVGQHRVVVILDPEPDI